MKRLTSMGVGVTVKEAELLEDRGKKTLEVETLRL